MFMLFNTYRQINNNKPSHKANNIIIAHHIG